MSRLKKVQKKIHKSQVKFGYFPIFGLKRKISVRYWGGCIFYNIDPRIKCLYAKFISIWCPMQWTHPTPPKIGKIIEIICICSWLGYIWICSIDRIVCGYRPCNKYIACTYIFWEKKLVINLYKSLMNFKLAKCFLVSLLFITAFIHFWITFGFALSFLPFCRDNGNHGSKLWPEN